MNFIEKLFNDFNERYLKEAKAKGVDLGLQTVYTPIDKIEKTTCFRFADYITAETKTVGILFNTEFINYFIKELPDNYINNIKFTFFYDCKFDYNEVQDCIFFSQKNINIEMISIENIKDLDKVMAGKKFDIVFSNPPYNNNLDLKILNSLFENSKNIILIHPASWCFCRDFTAYKFLATIYNHRKKLKSLNLFWGNKLFNIGLFSSLCISHWTPEVDNNFTLVNDKAYSNETYNSLLGDFSYHGKNNEANDLKLKIKEYMQKHEMSILDHNIKAGYSNMTDFSVRFAVLRGHSHAEDGLCEDFYSLICKNRNENKCDHTYRFSKAVDVHLKNIMTLWSFNTESEQNNFINYCCTKIVRFLLTFTKTNANIIGGQVTNIIPWMDFTQEWNDAKLCKEFEISEELWQYIDNFIPDYYEDYKSGF